MPHRHLANAVKYILDEKNNEAKTCDGLYVGGNAGYDSEDIIKTFLDTKELYGKLHGRQGYHFVISFELSHIGVDILVSRIRLCNKFVRTASDEINVYFYG